MKLIDMFLICSTYRLRTNQRRVDRLPCRGGRCAGTGAGSGCGSGGRSRDPGSGAADPYGCIVLAN